MEKNINNYCYPMIAPSVFGREDDKDEILSRWDRFDLLEEGEKEVMISRETASIIDEISRSYGFQRRETEEIARLVRDLFFKNVLKEQLVSVFLRRLPIVPLEAVKRIVAVLNEKIFKRALELKKEQANNFIQLSLNELLEKYQNIEEQLISENMLAISAFSGPVRPSIKNWILDYRDNLGAGKHSPIERGNYLFHSPNAKKLSAQERQRVGIVLRSLDEETPLTIDVNEQKIVFDANQQKNDNLQQMESNRFQQQIDTPQQRPQFAGVTTINKSNQEVDQTEDIFERFKNTNHEVRLNKAQSFFSKQNQEVNQQSSKIVAPTHTSLADNSVKNGQPNPIDQNRFGSNIQAPRSGDIKYGSPNFQSVIRPHSISDPEEVEGGTVSYTASQKLPFEQTVDNNVIKNASQSVVSTNQEIEKQNTQPSFGPSDLKSATSFRVTPQGLQEKPMTSRNVVNLKEL